MFQFQFGAIKRGFERIDDTQRRLFQFQFGAIKSNLNGLVTNAATCFNSNLVRLKAEIEAHELDLIREFQFQFGAIKRSIIA